MKFKEEQNKAKYKKWYHNKIDNLYQQMKSNTKQGLG
jgi:hypothetical protein